LRQRHAGKRGAGVMQTSPSPRRDSNADHGRPGVDAHLNVLHRAPEPNAKDASPAIHAADERS
jgi:hypothetical protein